MKRRQPGVPGLSMSHKWEMPVKKNTRPYMTLILALQKKKNTFQPQLVGDSEGK